MQNWRTSILVVLFQLISTASPQRLSLCLPDSETTAFLASEDYGIPNGTVTTQFGLSQDQCLSECSNSENCASFEYTKEGSCRLNPDSIQKGSQLALAPGVTYFQKICLPAKVAPCGRVFIREPQKLLLGYAQVVYIAPTVAACLAKCLETTKPESDFTCGSLHFYYRDQQCILNSETKSNFPDLFSPESVADDEVDYIENSCFPSISWLQWAAWGPCRNPGLQLRYRNCSISDQCKNGSNVEIQSCIPEPPNPSTIGVATVAVTEAVITQSSTVDPSLTDTGPAQATSPDGTNTQTGCTSSYCKGGGDNPCQDYSNLGYSSYGDCLRGHFNRNGNRRTQ